MPHRYSFDQTTKTITVVYSYEENGVPIPSEQPPLRINLANDTISEAEIMVPLGEQHAYTFLDVTANIAATPSLMDALLTSNYYANVFLPYSLGTFNTPIEDSVLLMFSSFILPYEILYREMKQNPPYAQQILAVYDKNHSVFIRKFKEFVRLILIIPGLICTPLILLMILPALKKMT
jgi:hypothetical protein